VLSTIDHYFQRTVDYVVKVTNKSLLRKMKVYTITTTPPQNNYVCIYRDNQQKLSQTPVKLHDSYTCKEQAIDACLAVAKQEWFDYHAGNISKYQQAVDDINSKIDTLQHLTPAVADLTILTSSTPQRATTSNSDWERINDLLHRNDLLSILTEWQRGPIVLYPPELVSYADVSHVKVRGTVTTALPFPMTQQHIRNSDYFTCEEVNHIADGFPVPESRASTPVDQSSVQFTTNSEVDDNLVLLVLGVNGKYYYVNQTLLHIS